MVCRHCACNNYIWNLPFYGCGDFMQKKTKFSKKSKPKLSAGRKVTKKASKVVARKAAAHKKPAKIPHNIKSTAVVRKSDAAAKKIAEHAGDQQAAADELVRIKDANQIISGELFSEFVVKNVGKQGVELTKALNASPHTDDKLASRMDIKVNEVRRMLNVLNGYGITKYDINKDGKGWLTFRWYLDREKLNAFHGVLQEKQNGQKINLQENCNDFFYCDSCYKNQKLILPFDSAYELNFKCEGCGKILGVLNKEQANALFTSNSKPSI